MILLEKAREDCISVDRAEAAGGARAALLRKWGVGKPGGFTNRYDDPRAGGAVVLLGGITNRLYFASPRRLSFDPRQLAEVGIQHSLRATPNEEEQRFPAPAAGGMASDEARSFGGGEGGLSCPEDKTVGPGAEVRRGAGFLAISEGEQICREARQFGGAR